MDKKAEYMAIEGAGHVPSHGSLGFEGRKQAKKDMLSISSPSPRLSPEIQGTTLRDAVQDQETLPTHPLHSGPMPPDSAPSQMSAHS